jgi:flagellar protein FliO/FliZ
MALPRENPDPHLKVLARVPLTSDSFAAVISLGAKAWLVGGGSGGVNLISEVDDAESLETMLLEDAKKNAEPRRFFDFRSLLRFGRDGKKGLSDNGSLTDNGYPLDSLRKQRERLKGL